MKKGQWGRTCARAIGVATLAALALLGACGGGDDDSPPPLAVTVKVNGAAAGEELNAGEAATIDAPSGATLVFDSVDPTRWAPTATDSSFHVDGFSFTSKAVTVASNGGGTLVVVFTNKADETQKATLTVNVAPKEFERVAAIDGESSDWMYDRTNRAGQKTMSTVRTHLSLNGDAGDYSVAVETLTGNVFFSTTNYDALDRVIGIGPLDTGCKDDAPVANFSYPLHVGKQWSGTSTRTCDGTKVYDQAYDRVVEAFERISVPAGSFDTLRIKSAISITNTSGTDIPGESYAYTRTCWWSVTLGRNVKCQFDYDYPDGTPDPYLRSQTQTMTQVPTH